MRLSEPIEKTGFFWAPEDADNRVPGILRIAETGAATLEVFGLSKGLLSRHPLDDPFLSQRAEAINRIVGVVGKNESVTLDGCFKRSWNSNLGGLWTITIHAHRALIGAIYEDGEDIAFSKISFSVEGLDEWLGISGIQVDHNWNEKSASIHFDPPKDIALHLPGGMEMRFGFRWTLPGFPSITEARVTQKAYVALISTELRPLDDFVTLIFKIHTFLCFAINKNVSLESITAYSTELTQKLNDGSTYEPPIKVYYESLLQSETEPKIRLPDMLFLYRGIEKECQGIFNRWLKNYETSEPTFNLYFASKAGAYKYLDGKFLSLVQGIETLHRRNSQETFMSKEEFSNLVDTISKSVPNDRREWIGEKLKYANELPLRKRVGKMIEPFEDFFGSNSERKHFISKVVATRNYLTHYDSGIEDQAASGEDLRTLCRKLEALVQLHFLRLIGIKDEDLSAIVKGNFDLRDKLGIGPPEPFTPPSQNTELPPGSPPALE